MTWYLISLVVVYAAILLSLPTLEKKKILEKDDGLALAIPLLAVAAFWPVVLFVLTCLYTGKLISRRVK